MDGLRVVFSGGGTGGHVFPALAIAQELVRRNPGSEIMFIGARRGQEVELVPAAGFPLQLLELSSLPRKLSRRQLVALYQAYRGVWEASKMLNAFAPQVVVGTGGYVAGPTLLAAALSRIPTVIHEQNAFPSLTNRILGRFVSRVAVSHQEAVAFFPAGKAQLTGNPLRPQVLSADRITARRRLGLGDNDLVLLAVGGSGGALGLNLAVLGAYERLLAAGVKIIHITGRRDYDRILSAAGKAAGECLRIIDFSPDFPDLLAASDLAVSRPGSTTSELAFLGIPAILVPSPVAANDHQTHNALAAKKAGAAEVMAEADLDPDVLADLSLALLADRARLSRMASAFRSLARPQAAADICRIIEQSIGAMPG